MTIQQPEDNCPTPLAPASIDGIPADMDLQPYVGDSNVFYCGFTGLVEANPREGCAQQEYFFDDKGKLVDEDHPYAGCAGTPNHYVASWDFTGNVSDDLNTLNANWNHMVHDVFTENGIDGLSTSIEYHTEQGINWAGETIQESYEQAINWANRKFDLIAERVEQEWDSTVESINDAFDRLIAVINSL